jgi:hypothetical protein
MSFKRRQPPADKVGPAMSGIVPMGRKQSAWPDQIGGSGAEALFVFCDVSSTARVF